MDFTLDQWVDYLTKRMQATIPRVKLLISYTTNNAPLPEMGKNLRKSWETFQRRATANAGKLIVSTLVERIIPNGILIDEAGDGEAVKTARRIWRDNRLDVVFADCIRASATTGLGYLLTTKDSFGRAVITWESPLMMYAESDPARPWRARAAIKVWRDETAGEDHLALWADGVYATYTRKLEKLRSYELTNITGEWMLDHNGVSTYSGSVPVVILENLDRKGEFEDHLGLLDRINTGILQRLVTTAMQAYRQRALKTQSDAALPEADEEGNAIDYQNIFEPGPGALWELPPGVDLWESQQTDIRPMLDAIKDDWRELAAATHTPLSAMLPDSANQSATGAEQPMRQLVAKANDRIKRFQPALALCLVKALEIEGIDLNGATLEVKFEPPATVSMSEKYAAATQARATGLALETIQESILGFSPQEIAIDKRRRLNEALDLALVTAPPTQTIPPAGDVNEPEGPQPTN